MRHGSIDLTMNTYTDSMLLDVAGAMDVLPDLPLDDSTGAERQKATGTDGRSLVPTLASLAVNRCISGTTADKTGGNPPSATNVVTSYPDKGSVREACSVEQPPIGFGPMTCGLQNRCSTN